MLPDFTGKTSSPAQPSPGLYSLVLLHHEYSQFTSFPSHPLTYLHNLHHSPRSKRRQWHLTPVLLPGKSHGWRSLVGCSPWSHEESDTTQWLHFHFSLSCIGEGNGNLRQCSCLENPRDGGAWWAAVYGVTQSRTRLRRLSSSCSSSSSPNLKETVFFCELRSLQSEPRNGNNWFKRTLSVRNALKCL